MQSRAGRSAMIASLDRLQFLAGAAGLSLAGTVQTLAQPADLKEAKALLDELENPTTLEAAG